MRRGMTLSLFVLLAVTAAISQSSAGTNNPSARPQASPNQTMPPSAAAGGEDMQRNTPPAQNPGSGAGQPANSFPTANGQSASPVGAQNDTTEAPNAQSVSDQIPAGTEIRATLDTPLSTKTSKAGDRFTATIAAPARGGNGYVVIPAGARVEGEVAEPEDTKALAALRDKGQLSLRFRDVVLPAGQTLPLTATLISVNDTNGKQTKKADEEGQARSGMHGKDVAKDLGAEPGMGNATGLVFGSPLKGLAIGALAGGGYVLATKGREVNLPAQTGMVIRLDQPVSGSGVMPK